MEFGSSEDKLALLGTLFAQKSELSVDEFQKLKDVDAVVKALETVEFEAKEVIIRADDRDSESKLVIFRRGNVEIFVVPEVEAFKIFPQRRRSSVKDGAPRSSTSSTGSSTSRRGSAEGKPRTGKEKRIAMLKSPCFVGENWVMTGAVPTASVKIGGEPAEGYVLPSSAYRTLMEQKNQSIAFISRALEVHQFERQFMLDFYTSMFRHNAGDQVLMQAFSEYGHKTLSSENFEFFKAIHDIKQKEATSPDFTYDDALALVDPIWTKFIDGGLLNISAKVKKQITANKTEAQSKQSTKLLCAVFDDAVIFVNKAIQKTLAPDFIKSSYYEDFVRVRFPMPRRNSRIAATPNLGEGLKEPSPSSSCVIL